MRPLLLIVMLSGLAVSAADAQSSEFGVRGLGLPGRSIGARSRATGGSFGLFDPESSLNPATLADFPSVTAGFVLTPEWRHWENPSGSASLRDTRFPLIYVGGPVPNRPFALGLSFSGYADRDFKLGTTDTILLRGVPVAAFDTLTSTGGLNDFRIAASYRPGPNTTLGGGFHIITGSARLDARRIFSDTAYLPSRQTAELSYGGIGFSLGAVHRFSPTLLGALMIRSDGKASVDRDSTPTYTIDLPYTFAAGLAFRPSSTVQGAVQAIYRTWSASNSDFLNLGGLGAVNTLDLSAGVEITTNRKLPTHRPVRFGVRYADLPFPLTPGTKAHEFGLSAGTGTHFAHERAGVDLALEQVWRSEGAFKERALLFTLGISVRP